MGVKGLRVKIGTGTLSLKLDKMLEGNLVTDSYPAWGKRGV